MESKKEKAEQERMCEHRIRQCILRPNMTCSPYHIQGDTVQFTYHVTLKGCLVKQIGVFSLQCAGTVNKNNL